MNFYKKFLRNLFSLNVMSTLYLKIFYNFDGLIFKKGKLKLSKGAQLRSKNGIFNFNSKWVKCDPFCALLFMGVDSKLFIGSNFSIYSGAKVYINKNAQLFLGSGFINHNANISCFNKISIGENVVISENVIIRDSDNHHINNKPNSAPIKIGNNVWIGMNVTILKGVTIGDGAVIASNTLINKDVPENCLVGGIPQKILKENVIWQ